MVVRRAAKLWAGVRMLRDPYGFLDEGLRRDGLTFWRELPILGRALLTGDPQLVQEIATHPDLESGKGIRALRATLGEGSLITLDGAAHRARRRLVAPALLEPERFDAFTDRITREAALALPVGEPRPIYDLLLRVTRRVILRAVFGELEPAREARGEALVQAFLTSLRNPLALYLETLRVDVGGLGAWGRMRRARARLRAFITEHLAQPGAGPSLAAHVAGHDEDLVNEVLALILFGHDTGASTMAWACAHLHQHPEWIARARADDAVLEACIEESMRLCPVVVHLTRVAARDTTVGGHPVAAGQRVLPSAWLAQHDPAVFADPHAFRPDRFLNGPVSPFSQFPFGIGARVCVGRTFVRRQMRSVLGALLAATRLELAPGYTPRPTRRLVVIVPSDGVPLVRTR